MLLTAAAILEAKDLRFEDVEVPEWGGTIRLRQVPAIDALTFTELVAKDENARLGIYLILIYCAFDTDDNRLFPLPKEATTRDEKIAEYIEGLGAKNLAILNKLQHVALRVNNMIAATQAPIKND